jgi:hypothetical protein
MLRIAFAITGIVSFLDITQAQTITATVSATLLRNQIATNGEEYCRPGRNSLTLIKSGLLTVSVLIQMIVAELLRDTQSIFMMVILLLVLLGYINKTNKTKQLYYIKIRNMCIDYII